MRTTYWKMGLCLLAAFIAWEAPLWAAATGSDHAGNYAAWTNGSTAGAGFEPWELTTWQEYAGHFLGASTNGGANINIDTSGVAFGMYANPPESNSYANATRYFSGGALAVGQTFTIQLGVNYWNGNKGLNLLNNSGQPILNVNFNEGGGIQIISGNPAETNNLGWSNSGDGYNYTARVTRINSTMVEFELARHNASASYQKTLGAAPAGIHLYTGGTEAGDPNNLYFNSMSITEPLALSFSGTRGLVVAQTATVWVVRNGATGAELQVQLEPQDTNVLDLSTRSVTIAAGESQASFTVMGVKRGQGHVLALADGFATGRLDTVVYQLGYDDSAHYQNTTWTNGANAGTGFEPWIAFGNAGGGEGFTNHCGLFLGDSTQYGGGNVNSHSNHAFGLYANKEGAGGTAPEYNMTRPFAAPVAGQMVSAAMGVNYRNGAKGIMFQNGFDWLFEVSVQDNKYIYQNRGMGGEPQDLGWEYQADTAISVQLFRNASGTYEIEISRSGATTESFTWRDVDLGADPDRARFYVYNTEAGGENNLYFNYLGRDELPWLTLTGPGNIPSDGTRTITVARSGSTNAALSVALLVTDTNRLSVPASVEIPAGASAAQFEVTGLAGGIIFLEARATDYWRGLQVMNVMNFATEFDEAGNYAEGTFTNGANGGAGLAPWAFEGLSDGAFVGLRDSRTGSGDLNSINRRAFAVMGGTNGNYAAVNRNLLSALAASEQLQFRMGLNYDGGNRGVDLRKLDGSQLFNFNLANPDSYSATFEGAETIELGWSYCATAIVTLAVEQRAGDQLAISLQRNDGLSTNLLSGPGLGAVGSFRFYNGGHDGSSAMLGLYANDILVTRNGTTEGIPNAWWDRYGIAASNRLAAGDMDNDTSDNYTEYCADTDPTNALSFYANQVTTLAGRDTFQLQAGPPTTNSRRYDVWWCTNLVAGSWTPFLLNVPGADDGSAVTLSVTNDASQRYYRTGVKVP